MGVIASAITLSLAVAGAAVAAPERGPTPSLSGPADLLRLDVEVRAALTSSHRGNTPRCGSRFDRVHSLAQRAEFDRLPASTHRLVLALALACTEGDRAKTALTLIGRLETLVTSPAEVADINEALLRLARGRGDKPEAARRLIGVIDAEPRRVAGWWSPFISPVVAGVEDDEALSTALLQRLTSLAWEDPQSGEAARNYWAGLYAGRLLDRGDVAGARKVLSGANDPAVLIEIAEQRRFAPLWPTLEAEGRFDWRALTEAALKRRQAAAAAEPKALVHVLRIQSLLRQLQRYDEAIALGEGLQMRMLAGEAFTDGDKQANWVLNELGYALGDVGRYAEAETAFKASVTVGENGGPSVSQAINWGQTLLDLERPKEALASVDNIKGGASPYGVMWADAIRVCANAVLDPAAAKRQLEGMTAREDDNEAALTQALLCLDRQDEAAAAYIRRLASPKRRDGAISAFRVVLPPPVMTARQKEMERRKQAVLARPDVRQALEPVGRALTLPLAGSYWGEY